MTRNRILICAILVVVVVLLLPLGQVAVFDGHFNLTITIDPQFLDNFSSVLFATCWTDEHASYAMETGSDGETGFESGKASVSGGRVISVPYSGRLNAFGDITSYHEPRYLVVEYETESDAVPTQRIQYSIPSGRGVREVRVNVP
jgi:hypothetical protein